MNATISVFVIFVEAIIYLLIYNLYNFTFKIDFSNPKSKSIPMLSSKKYAN